MVTRTAALCLLGLLAAAAALAGQPASKKSIGKQSPLYGLPGKPGPHVARIRALGDNSWLELGAPRPDPKWGPARGRSYSAPMPCAPKLSGAFLFGNGPHGAMFKGNHYGDELYFYDANAHAWICAYPGFDVTRYGEVEINKENGRSSARPLPDWFKKLHREQYLGYKFELPSTVKKKRPRLPYPSTKVLKYYQENLAQVLKEQPRLSRNPLIMYVITRDKKHFDISADCGSLSAAGSGRPAA